VFAGYTANDRDFHAITALTLFTVGDNKVMMVIVNIVVIVATVWLVSHASVRHLLILMGTRPIASLNSLEHWK